LPRIPVTADDLPAGPPPEVLRQVEVAWERAQDLLATELELRFEVDHEERRVWVDLFLSDGTPIGRLSAKQALALACGHPYEARIEG
jgi:hypothetical protein